MVKEEFWGGLRNAVERGENLEEAGQSFINAGYNPEEVREAMNSLGSEQANQSMQATSEVKVNPVEKKSPFKKFSFGENKKIIILISILVVLGVILGISIFFKAKIIEFVSGLS